jgi:hypothetical protein
MYNFFDQRWQQTTALMWYTNIAIYANPQIIVIIQTQHYSVYLCFMVKDIGTVFSSITVSLADYRTAD